MNVRRVALGLALSIAVLGQAAAQTHDKLTLGMVQFPPDLHPSITETSIKDYILSAALRGMTGFDAKGEVMCQLCTEVPSLDNGRAKLVKRADGGEGIDVRYTLKDDLYWADGVKVTAKDVAFGFEVVKAFTVPASIEAVEALDERDVLVRFKLVRYDFDRSDGVFGVPSPISEHIEGPIFRAAANALDYGQKSAFNRRPEEPGLWLGPYRISEFRPNESVTLAPNPHWKGPKPAFASVTMRLVENTSALQANLLSGAVDMVIPGNLGITLDQHLALQKSAASQFDWTFVPSVASFEHLAVNFDNKLLADKAVRQAIQMGIDRQTLVTKLFDGKFQVSDGPKHPSQFGYDPGVKHYNYDPKAARELLAKAGYKPGADGFLVSPKGEKLSFDLVSTSGNRVRELVEQVIQTQLKAIGIEIVIKNEPARVMFGETLRKRTFTGLLEFQTDASIDSIPNIYYHSRSIPSADNNYSGLNYMGYNNPALDQAILDGWAALDKDTRRKAWSRISAILAEELPEIYLYFPTSAVLTPKWLTGVINPERYGLFNTMWIENWRVKN